nr:helix-turn-helix domain-containing protein [Cronobacter sakazakii]
MKWISRVLDLVKPLHHLDALQRHLAPSGTPFDIDAHCELSFINEQGEQQCWFFKEGSLNVWREENHIHVDLMTSPLYLSFSDAVIPEPLRYTLITETPCRGFRMPVRRAIEIIEHRQLWKSFCHWQTWLMRWFEWRDAHFIGTTTYSQIRSTLLTMAAWSPEVRAQVGVIHHIQNHTHISRSVIAEILAELRKGKYIEMQKGKLVAVNKLPLNY